MFDNARTVNKNAFNKRLKMCEFDEICLKSSSYGNSYYKLTPKDIEVLLKGNVLYDVEEYGTFIIFADETIDPVAQWAKEHPEKKRKTYAEDFFEKFPKAEPKYYDGRGKKQMIPIPCRQHCYGVVGQKCNGIGCSCSACWNEEMEADHADTDE